MAAPAPLPNPPVDVAERLSALPSVDELLRTPALAPVLEAVPRALATRACRMAVAETRARWLAGEPGPFDADSVRQALDHLQRPNLRPVLNATGVVLHTNLGRAPLSRRAVERLADVSRGYANLELDLDSGERGSRYAHVTGLLRELTGAEAALVVNNCAAAALLTLSALARGREVVVSRGELVEIGGGFRVPEVMAQSGARLVEVGTTNRTRLQDYAQAVGPDTGLLAKIHQSNFAIVGFTEAATVEELATLARARALPLFVDLGSGVLTPLSAPGLTTEPTVPAVVAAGADVVAFSGDKLLGGPQAGLVVGRADLITALERHPLNRALRVGKLTVAALEATLEAYRDGVADQELPVRAMLGGSREALEARARTLASALGAARVAARLVEVEGQVGGGSMPLASPASFAVEVRAPAEALSAALRRATPPVLARIQGGAVLLDVRCLADEDLPALVRAVTGAVAGCAALQGDPTP